MSDNGFRGANSVGVVTAYTFIGVLVAVVGACVESGFGIVLGLVIVYLSTKTRTAKLRCIEQHGGRDQLVAKIERLKAEQ